jgi:hypothetical protein
MVVMRDITHICCRKIVIADLSFPGEKDRVHLASIQELGSCPLNTTISTVPPEATY